MSVRKRVRRALRELAENAAYCATADPLHRDGLVSAEAIDERMERLLGARIALDVAAGEVELADLEADRARVLCNVIAWHRTYMQGGIFDDKADLAAVSEDPIGTAARIERDEAILSMLDDLLVQLMAGQRRRAQDHFAAEQAVREVATG